MNLKKLIKEVLENRDCCKATKPTKAPILNESLAPREILSEGLKYHIDNKKPLTEHVYRAGSENYFNLWAEARALYTRGILDFSGDDLDILTETHLGEFGIYEGKKVPLDFIMEEEQEETTEFNINKVWDFIGSKPFYNKDYMPKFNTAEEIYDEFGPKEMELYNNFEWEDTYGDKLHPRELAARQRQANYNALAGLNEAIPVKEMNLSGEGVKDIVKRVFNDSKLLDFLNFSNFRDFLAFIKTGSLDDYYEIMDDIEKYDQQLAEGLNEDKITTDNLLNNPKTLVVDKEISIRGTQFKPKDKISVQYQFDDDDESFYSIKGYGQNDQNVKILYIPKKEMDNFLRNTSSYLTEIKDKKKTPPIGKPKRGGSKKFYVYIRDKGKIKKISFGDTSGLSAKLNNPKARQAFSKRHDCPNKKDRTKASYWSCRLPRYAKLLGLKSNFSGFW